MERVLVLGATSAIAAEVAVLHAKRGDQLHLVGRDPDKLATLRTRIPGASIEVADLVKVDAAALVQRAIDALGGIDRVLIAHGALGDQLATERDAAAAIDVITTNFTSAVALLVPLANHFEQARAGRIGVITSVAGDRGRSRNYTYGAAKGALTIYLQGVRTRLYASNVAVTTLKLGPVDTPMTRGHGKHALFGKVDRVARNIVRAMDARESEVYVPSVWALIMPLVKRMPERVFQKLAFLSGR
ncbi:MAG: SDR family NAD(P)-dependent oxidoreductase [Polyangia bacterium]